MYFAIHYKVNNICTLQLPAAIVNVYWERCFAYATCTFQLHLYFWSACYYQAANLWVCSPACVLWRGSLLSSLAVWTPNSTNLLFHVWMMLCQEQGLRAVALVDLLEVVGLLPLDAIPAKEVTHKVWLHSKAASSLHSQYAEVWKSAALVFQSKMQSYEYLEINKIPVTGKWTKVFWQTIWRLCGKRFHTNADPSNVLLSSEEDEESISKTLWTRGFSHFTIKTHKCTFGGRKCHHCNVIQTLNLEPVIRMERSQLRCLGTWRNFPVKIGKANLVDHGHGKAARRST